jgi:hypothetical protein
MKKLLIAAACVAAGSLALQDISSGHGGTYRGPGDTVPPGGGGGGGGGGAPGSTGPSTPGPSGPTTPGPASPGAPAGAPGGPSGPSTSGGGDAGPDLSIWQYWWGFNKEPYINLKAHIHSGSVVTGSDDFFLGRGEKTQSRDSLRPSEEAIRGKIVPALRKALENERSNDILDACLIALAKIGDAKAEDGYEPMSADIKKFLADSNQQLSETAAVSLGILANDSEDNINILLSLLADDSPTLRSTYKIQLLGSIPVRTRAYSAYGLGLIGYKASDETRQQIADALIALLDGEGKSLGTRDVQVASLIALGLTPLPLDPTAEPLELREPKKKASDWPKPEQVTNRQEQIAFAMNYFEDERGNNHLIRAHVPLAVARLLQDVPDDHWIRDAVATRLLFDIGKFSKESDEVKQSCVQALGVIGDCDEDQIDADIRTGLMEVKDNIADRQARNFALIALGQACGRPGKGAGDPVGGIVNAKKGKGPRAYLMNSLAKSQAGVRPWAALGLAVMERALGDAKQTVSLDAKRALRDSLRDSKSPAEVSGYAVAVGIVKDDEAKTILRDKLAKMGDDEARGYCAIGLGLMDDRGAIEQIQEVIQKSKYKPDLLKQAAIGLGLLGDKQIVDGLIDMLNQATGLSSQAAISSALGFIGDARSVDPLIGMLEDKQKTDLARGFAAAALGIVADKEDLPWNTKISVNINYRANTTTLTNPASGDGILDLL